MTDFTLTDEHRALIAECEERNGRRTVALVLDDDGAIYDQCWTWETGQSYAAQYRVVAVADDGHMAVEDAQRLYDYERRVYLDCFGED